MGYRFSDMSGDLLTSHSWKSSVRCPRCFSTIENFEKRPVCSNLNCDHNKTGFPVVNSQPVLIDFAKSIFDRAMYESGHASALPRDVSLQSFGSRLHQFISGKNPIAAKNVDAFRKCLRSDCRRPVVLVIGGGTIGSGAYKLYRDSSVDLVGMDVYASPHTALVADAHTLPFETGMFDGVWIQAVLEHVLEPSKVVAEIHRVLKPSGIVYAETPFMQQVHERAYDFTRFTQSGHRWLFKQFEEIDAGQVSGPGVALIWSIRYFARALGAGDKVSRLISLPFFWLRFLDAFGRGRAVADAASGFFFLGRRSDQTLSPQAMLHYYAQQK